jgi:hypothetical protein
MILENIIELIFFIEKKYILKKSEKSSSSLLT